VRPRLYLVWGMGSSSRAGHEIRRTTNILCIESKKARAYAYLDLPRYFRFWLIMTACRKHERDPSMMQIMRARLSPGNDRYINEPPGRHPTHWLARFSIPPSTLHPTIFEISGRSGQFVSTPAPCALLVCGSVSSCCHSPHSIASILIGQPAGARAGRAFRYRLVVVEWHRHAAYRTSSVSTAPWLKAATDVDPSHS
jgi:hypothetical protein